MKKLFFVLALGMFTTAYAFTPVANPTNAFKASKRFAFDATQLSVPDVAEATQDEAITFAEIEFDYAGQFQDGNYAYYVILYASESAGYLPQLQVLIKKANNEKHFSGDFTAVQAYYVVSQTTYGLANNCKLSITEGEDHNYTITGSFTYGSKIPKNYTCNVTAKADYGIDYLYEPYPATTLELNTTGEIDFSYLSYGYVDINSADADGNALNLSFYTADKTITTIPDGTYNIANAANSFLKGYYYGTWETTAEEEGPVNSFAETEEYYFYLYSGTVVVLNDAKGLHLTVNAVSYGESTVTAECLVPASPQAVENVTVDTKAIKVVEDGQIFIIRNGVKYNAVGTVVR